jgi:hypothetical protein
MRAHDLQPISTEPNRKVMIGQASVGGPSCAVSYRTLAPAGDRLTAGVGHHLPRLANMSQSGQWGHADVGNRTKGVGSS